MTTKTKETVRWPIPSVYSVVANSAHGEVIPDDLPERLKRMPPQFRRSHLMLRKGRLHYWSTSVEACSGNWLLIPTEKTNSELFWGSPLGTLTILALAGLAFLLVFVLSALASS